MEGLPDRGARPLQDDDAADDEFIRRFLMHVLPKGLHRIRHYGLFANGDRAANIARARELLAVPAPAEEPETPNATSADEPHDCHIHAPAAAAA